jgi:nucleoside-diphosphate-sugar epimerase
MAKIIITGSSGFLGSRLASSYAAIGNEVVGYDMNLIPHFQYRQVEQNLLTADFKSIFSSIQPDLVIHCAGNANVGISVANPELDFELGVHLLHRMLFGLKASGQNPHFLFLSSAAVYGDPESLPIGENSAIRPISPYGLHKAVCEDICKYFSRTENIPISVVRIFSAYGPGLRKQLFWDISQKIFSGKPFELFGTGDETRDFINFNDVIQAIHYVSKRPHSGIYNVANGIQITIRQAAEYLMTAFNRNIQELKFNGKRKPGDPQFWEADISNLKSLGFKPTITLEAGLHAYAEWIKNGAM